MSNVIQFLETAGRNAMLSPADYAAAVAALDVDDAHRQALADRDHAALNDLLDGRVKMFCYVATPDDNEHESVPDDEDDKDGDDVPDQDGSPYQTK